jgi:hypothetical protein
LQFKRYPFYFCMKFTEDFTTAPGILVTDVLYEWIVKCTDTSPNQAKLQEIRSRLIADVSGRRLCIQLTNWDAIRVGNEIRLQSRANNNKPTQKVETISKLVVDNLEKSITITHPRHIQVKFSEDLSLNSSILTRYVIPINLSSDFMKSQANIKLELCYLDPNQDMDAKKILKKLKVVAADRDRVILVRNRSSGTKHKDSLVALLYRDEHVYRPSDEEATVNLFLQECLPE